MSDEVESEHREGTRTLSIDVELRGPVLQVRRIPFRYCQSATYPCADGVDNISATALQALPGIGDHDRHVGVFVKNLLNTAVVASRLPFGYSASCGWLIIIARICGVDDVFVAFRGRSSRILEGLVCITKAVSPFYETTLDPAEGRVR